MALSPAHEPTAQRAGVMAFGLLMNPSLCTPCSSHSGSLCSRHQRPPHSAFCILFSIWNASPPTHPALQPRVLATLPEKLFSGRDEPPLTLPPAPGSSEQLRANASVLGCRLTQGSDKSALHFFTMKIRTDWSDFFLPTRATSHTTSFLEECSHYY